MKKTPDIEKKKEWFKPVINQLDIHTETKQQPLYPPPFPEQS